MRIFRKTKKAKLGFSLIELVVAFAIVAVLGGVLIPSLVASANDTRKKNDDATMGHLTELHQAAAQEHATYYYFSQTVNKLAEGEKSIYFWYESDEEGNVTFKAMNLAYPTGITAEQQEEINHWAGQFKVKVCDYISGTYDFPQMEAPVNKSQTYIVCISATNREYLVRVNGYWLPTEDD